MQMQMLCGSVVSNTVPCLPTKSGPHIFFPAAVLVAAASAPLFVSRPPLVMSFTAN